MPYNDMLFSKSIHLVVAFWYCVIYEDIFGRRPCFVS